MGLFCRSIVKSTDNRCNASKESISTWDQVVRLLNADSDLKSSQRQVDL